MDKAGQRTGSRRAGDSRDTGHGESDAEGFRTGVECEGREETQRLAEGTEGKKRKQRKMATKGECSQSCTAAHRQRIACTRSPLPPPLPRFRWPRLSPPGPGRSAYLAQDGEVRVDGAKATPVSIGSRTAVSCTGEAGVRGEWGGAEDVDTPPALRSFAESRPPDRAAGPVPVSFPDNVRVRPLAGRATCPNRSATASVCPLSTHHPFSSHTCPFQVPLSVVKKKGKDAKAAKIEHIRNCIQQHKNVFIFKYDHMKTEMLQQIRRDWAGSR